MILIINDLNYPSKISNLLDAKLNTIKFFHKLFIHLAPSMNPKYKETSNNFHPFHPSIERIPVLGIQSLSQFKFSRNLANRFPRRAAHAPRRSIFKDRSARDDGRGVGVAYTPLKSYARRGVYTDPVRPAPLTLIRSAEAAPNTKRAGRCSAPRSELTRERGTGPTRMQKKRRAGRFFCARRT